MSDGNVPADTAVRDSDRNMAVALFSLAADALGGIPESPDQWNRFGFQAAELAAEVANDFSGPLDRLTSYLTQVRVSREKRPVKGILRSVKEIEVATSQDGKALRKVEVTIEATSGGKFSKAGSIETFKSHFTHAFGFRNFLAQTEPLVGREVLVYKYLEDTEGRGAGATANVVVRVMPIGPSPTPHQSSAEGQVSVEVPVENDAGSGGVADPKIVEARKAAPATKKAIVEAAIKHLGFDKDTAADTCRRVAGDLNINIGSPSPEDIAKMWVRIVNEHAAASVAAA